MGQNANRTSFCGVLMAAGSRSCLLGVRAQTRSDVLLRSKWNRTRSGNWYCISPYQSMRRSVRSLTSRPLGSIRRRSFTSSHTGSVFCSAPCLTHLVFHRNGQVCEEDEKKKMIAVLDFWFESLNDRASITLSSLSWSIDTIRYDIICIMIYRFDNKLLAKH